MFRIGAIIVLVVCCAGMGLAQSGAPGSSDAPSNQPPPAHPQPVHLSNEMMLGRVAHKTMPVYPDEAMRKGIQGDVIFKIEVDETGKITASTPVEGDPLLMAASKDALRTFRFHPYVVDGTPTRVRSELGFHFSTEKTADGVNAHVECMASIPTRP
jgi:periplasmic protein TonB